MDSVNADRVLLCRVSPFGNLRLNAYLRLPVAYRSLSRPSSAPSAKAFPLRPLQLDLFVAKSASFRFQMNLKTPLRSLAPHFRFKPAALGFESAQPLRGFLGRCYIARIRIISVILAICSTIFRSYPNNIQKNHLFFCLIS